MDDIARKIDRGFVVKSASDWFSYVLEMPDDEICERLDDKNFCNKFNKIDEIITLQVSYYAHRHIAGLGGHHSDNLARLESKAKKEYQELTGQDYYDPNKDIDW